MQKLGLLAVQDPQKDRQLVTDLLQVIPRCVYVKVGSAHDCALLGLPYIVDCD